MGGVEGMRPGVVKVNTVLRFALSGFQRQLVSIILGYVDNFGLRDSSRLYLVHDNNF